MTNETQKTKADDLINQLCGDLQEVCPRCPYRNMAIWLGLSILYLVGIIAYLGIQVDIASRLASPAFLFEMGMALAILGTSVVAASFLSFPDSAGKDWFKIIAATLFGAFMLWVMTNSFVERQNIIQFFTMNSCSRGLLIELIPFVALIYLTVKGHSTQPFWLMAMNVMTVSALGWIGLRLTCTMYDSMLYGFLHYFLPFALVGVMTAFFARKIFKW